MKSHVHFAIIGILGCIGAVGCGGSASSDGTGGGGADSTTSTGEVSTTGSGGGSASACALADSTSPTATVSPSGCHVLNRDTSACEAARKAAGLSGYWLKLSCRVELSVASDVVTAKSDSRPDYPSYYFPKGDACYQDYAKGIHNPFDLLAESLVVKFSLTPDMAPKTMMGIPVVGMAVNGVPFFANFAGGPNGADAIYTEAKTFDACGAHPQEQGEYHYHAEPTAITYDDANFVGVLRDGYPLYGRKDTDGSYPTLDTYGGHTGITADSAGAAVYHYHVNEQTSTGSTTAGQKQWFVTTGTFRGTPYM
ncbi:MAG: YHYH protein [Byssovorax sp.]